MTGEIPAVILGGTGYVAGELLRLLASHPTFRPRAVVSGSQAGEPVAAAFPHLAGAYPDLAFAAVEALPELLPGDGPVAAFSAAPHGASAPLVDALLAAAEEVGSQIRLVDLSADFRFPSAEEYEAIYGHPHEAPHRLGDFTCALPEHLESPPPGHLGHPGCFPTAVLLPAVPLLKLGLVEGPLQVVAVTGSTGAGRTPLPTTHHPERRSNLFAYQPLGHRHVAEMERLAKTATGVEVEIHFVPQAGPFARGIYATLQGRLKHSLESPDLVAAVAGFYAGSSFLQVTADPPRLQDVVGTNRCHLGLVAKGRALAAFSAIDNLVKGAAGGAIQWLNRCYGLPETAGLAQPGLGWI